MDATAPRTSSILDVFNKPKPSKLSALVKKQEQCGSTVVTYTHLYNEAYLALRKFADSTYIRHWDSFDFERAAPELIPTVVNYLIEEHSPYGAYSKEVIELFVLCYMPKLIKLDCIRVWMSIQDNVWSQLGLDTYTPRRLAYRYDGMLIYYHLIDLKEFTNGDVHY